MRMASLAMVLAACTATSTAAAAAEPYRVTVLTDAMFDEQGQLRELTLIDEAHYSEAFVRSIRERLSKARIPPVLDDGKPATFKTGVAVVLEITPGDGEGQVRFTGLRVEPRVVKQYAASWPQDLGANWRGRLGAICQVGINGKCSSIEIDALPGIPPSARRFATASLEGWEFVPQRINDRPVEGQVKVVFNLSAENPFAENFRLPPMQRLRRTH